MGTFTLIVLLQDTPRYFKRGVFVTARQLQRVFVRLVSDDAGRSAGVPVAVQRERRGIPRSDGKLDFVRWMQRQVCRIPAARDVKRVDVQRFGERQHEVIIGRDADRDH